MNPGPSEEIGKIATSIVESLKGSPGVIALVVFNMFFLALIYFNTRDERQSVEKLQTALLAQQAKMTDMLVGCAPLAK